MKFSTEWKNHPNVPNHQPDHERLMNDVDLPLILLHHRPSDAIQKFCSAMKDMFSQTNKT